MTEIPEHLLKRAQWARERNTADSQLQSSWDDISGTELPSDITDLVGLVDINSPEICNLSALAIRQFISKRIDADDKMIDSLLPTTPTFLKDGIHITANRIALAGFSAHREVVIAHGTPSIIRQDREWVWGSHLGLESLSDNNQSSSVRLGVWTGDKVIPNPGLFTRERIERQGIVNRQNLPFSIGITSDAGDIRSPLLVPLLKSVKAPNGCHLVFADGQEIDAEQFNRPEIINRTLALLENADEMTIYEIASSLQVIADNAEDSDMQKKVELLKLLHTEDPSLTVEKEFMSRHLREEAKDRDFWNQIGYGHLGSTEAIQQRISSGVHNLKYLLSRRNWATDSVTGLESREYQIHGTLDEERYGEEAAEDYKFLRYSIKVDELLGVRMFKSTPLGELEPCDDRDKRDIGIILKLIDKNKD